MKKSDLSALRPICYKRAPHFDLGLIVEPQFSDGAFVSARKGSASFGLVARGKSAHAGRDFHNGINAIMALLPSIQLLQGLNDPSNGSILNIGKIMGGTAVNIVPDLAIVEFGIRSSNTDSQQLLIKQIQAIVDEARVREGTATLDLHLLSYRGPKPFDNTTQTLFSEVKKCAEILNISMEWRESGGVCDGNTLASAGLPVIDSMGAAGGNIHTFDEYIDLDKMPQRARHVALVLMAIASGDFVLPKQGLSDAIAPSRLSF